MNTCNKQKISLTTLLLTVGIALTFAGVPSAFAYETSGWLSFGQNLGADYSCGGTKSLHSWKIMDEVTGASVAPLSVKVYIENVLKSSQTGVTETTPLCFEPTTEHFKIVIDGGTNYYSGGYNKEYPIAWVASSAVVAQNKRYRGNIYLRPKSFSGYDRSHVSPIAAGGVVSYLNYEPAYTTQLAYYPSSTAFEGTLTPLRFDSWVYNYNTTLMTGNVLTPLSGVGNYTQTPFGFTSDGLYSWYFGIQLKSSTGASNVVNSSSGWEKFYIDKTPPVAVASIAPASPTATDIMKVSITAQDVLAGLAKIDLYVDGVPAGISCNYTGTTASQTCVIDAGMYTVGTHNYYTITTDRAGNITKTVPASFTVTTPSCETKCLYDVIPCPAPCVDGESTCTWQNADCSTDKMHPLACDNQVCPDEKDKPWREVSPN